MAGYHGAFSRNSDTSTVELLKIFLNKVPMDIHRCFSVSHPRLRLHMIFPAGGLHVLGIALEEDP
jgi:hypothetical protein